MLPPSSPPRHGVQLEFGGRQFYDCSLQQEDFNPPDPWNYVASGQVGRGQGARARSIGRPPRLRWRRPTGAACRHRPCFGPGPALDACSTYRSRASLAPCAPPPPPPPPPCPPAVQCEPVENINEALKTTTDINGPPWEAAVLMGFLILSRLLVYIALRMKTKA